MISKNDSNQAQRNLYTKKKAKELQYHEIKSKRRK